MIHAGNEIITFLVMTLLFAMMFKLLPDTQVAWRDVWLGALLTAVLFTVGKLLIGQYLGKSALGSAYGAAGSLVVLVVWIYYSAQVLFLERSWPIHKGNDKREKERKSRSTEPDLFFFDDWTESWREGEPQFPAGVEWLSTPGRWRSRWIDFGHHIAPPFRASPSA